MPERYLEVSYRRGRPFAAYLFLPRRPDDRSARTERFMEALVIDDASDGRPIGIEIIHPQAITEQDVNRAPGPWPTSISRRSETRTSRR